MCNNKIIIRAKNLKKPTKNQQKTEQKKKFKASFPLNTLKRRCQKI